MTVRSEHTGTIFNNRRPVFKIKLLSQRDDLWRGFAAGHDNPGPDGPQGIQRRFRRIPTIKRFQFT